MMYAQNAITVNEFLGKSWRNVTIDHLVLWNFIHQVHFLNSVHQLVLLLQDAPGSTDTLGVVILKSRAMFSDPLWYWIGIVALLGYIVLFNFMATLALTYLKRTCHLSDLSCNHLHPSFSNMLLKNWNSYIACSIWKISCSFAWWNSCWKEHKDKGHRHTVINRRYFLSTWFKSAFIMELSYCLQWL